MTVDGRCAAYIDLSALAENYNLCKRKTDKKIIAVVKANAYGHGAVECAQKLSSEGCETFAVATVDEGIELRNNGISDEIILLGYFSAKDATLLQKYRLTPVIYDAECIDRLAAISCKIPCYIKFDTGMNRLGFAPETADYKAIRKAERLDVIGAFSHLSSSDSLRAEDKIFTQNQIKRFKYATDVLQAELGKRILKICASSAAVLGGDTEMFDGARVGIALYGISPSAEVPNVGLQAVMTLKSVITSVKTINSDSFVSYGRTASSGGIIKTAVAAIGYADGYPRTVSNRAAMLLNGVRVKVLGRVTMDQIVLDATQAGCSVGDEVTVLGGGVSAESLALAADTIPYEIVCRISARVPRIYI